MLLVDEAGAGVRGKDWSRRGGQDGAAVLVGSGGRRGRGRLLPCFECSWQGGGALEGGGSCSAMKARHHRVT